MDPPPARRMTGGMRGAVNNTNTTKSNTTNGERGTEELEREI